MSIEKFETNKKSSKMAILLKSLNLTQAEFAAALGVSQGVVANWVSGRFRPSRAAIGAIARKYYVEERWLTTGEGEMYKVGTSGAALEWNEPPGMYTSDPKRIELLIKVKKLILTADDSTIKALLSNVDEFSRIRPAKKKDGDDDK